MENKLNFNQTFTVEEFKAAVAGGRKVQVFNGVEDSKGIARFFFTWGNERDQIGTLAEKLREKAHFTQVAKEGNLRISECSDTETGDTFYMMHQAGEGGLTPTVVF
jgi:hypothetical protein